MVPEARKGLIEAGRVNIAELSYALESGPRLLQENPDRIPSGMRDFNQIAMYKRGAERQRRNAQAATLYWVTAPMSRMAAAAAQTLPEWSPLEAAPAQSGIALFEEPIGEVEAEDAHGPLRVPLNGLAWGIQDNVLDIAALSRLVGQQSARPRPLDIPVHTVYNLNRGLQVDDGAALSDWERHAVVNALGSLWLLMQQDSVATLTETGRNKKPKPDAPAPSSARQHKPDTIVVDLHPNNGAAQEVGDGESVQDEHRREYHHRWWVEGHWRQQACGPNRSQRRPQWIAPHLKGPADKPFIDARERVYKV